MTNSTTKTDDQTTQFLKFLRRGGEWANFWTYPDKITHWHKADRLIDIPDGEAVYFGIHPTTQKKRGRTTIETVEAINCLFSEFDARDFRHDKGAALAHVLGLDPRPSVVVDSGGGWHCYWLLREPFVIQSDDDRGRVRRLQAAWVEFTGGDDGAKDLARVLRVPGTKNRKYDPARDVYLYQCDFNRLYSLDQLEELIPEKPAMTPEAPGMAHNGNYPASGEKWLTQALSRAHIGSRNETGAWLAEQLRDDGLSQAEIMAVEYPERVTHGPGEDGQDYTRRDWERTVKSVMTWPPRPPARSNGNYHAAPVGLAGEPPEPEPPTNFDGDPDVDQQASTEHSQRFKIHTAAEALEPQPAVDWIIEKLFSPGSVSLVVGNPGSKKTYSMLSAGVNVAIGKKWLGFPTRQAKVLFVDEESGNRRMARRLGEVLRGEFADDTTPFEYISLAQFNLRDPADAILLHATIEQTGAELVIIDALADIMPGADENAVKDVHPVFMRMRKIAEETRAALVIIHHANKAGDYRGSSAISGAVDLLLMVESNDGSPTIDFETKKARDVEAFKFSAAAHWSDSQMWLSPIETSKRRDQLSRPQRHVINYLGEHGPSTRSAIITEPDICTSRAASDAIYQLAERGLIHRTNPPGRAVEAIYTITQEENE
jgi:hypothetical protein